MYLATIHNPVPEDNIIKIHEQKVVHGNCLTSSMIVLHVFMKRKNLTCIYNSLKNNATYHKCRFFNQMLLTHLLILVDSSIYVY